MLQIINNLVRYKIRNIASNGRAECNTLPVHGSPVDMGRPYCHDGTKFGLLVQPKGSQHCKDWNGRLGEEDRLQDSYLHVNKLLAE
jgi:hypothetical protein